MEPTLLTVDRYVDPQVGCSYRYILNDTIRYLLHYHDHYEVFVILDGCAWHLINGTKIKVEKGSMVFIRPDDIHDYQCIKGQRFSMLNFTFTKETIEELFAYLGNGFDSAGLLSAELPPSVLLDNHDLLKITSQMVSICAITPDRKAELKTALRVLLFRIFSSHFSITYTDVNAMPPWLEELCNKIKQNANFTGSSESIYALCGKSREHISRSMKKYTGMTMSEYVNNLRLQYILNMLDNSNHSITDIIFESGFGNISWACELFKKRYGVTMSEYRHRPMQAVPVKDAGRNYKS